MARKKICSTGKKVTAGVFAGAVVGAITALLLAPKKGKDLRADIKKTADKIAKDVGKKIAKVKDLTREKYEEIVDEAAKIHKRAKKVKDEDLKEIVAHIKNKWPEISRKIKGGKK